MVLDNDNGHNDKNQTGQKQENSIFDKEKNLVEDVDTIQDPYPAKDATDNDDMIDGEVENPDENKEYEDKDHPHETNPPRAVVDVDYQGVSGDDSTNAYEQQNPLQSTIPSSDSDR
jgi:hypothetical protein